MNCHIPVGTATAATLMGLAFSAIASLLLLSSSRAYAQGDEPIPAVTAIDPQRPELLRCNVDDITETHTTARADPEWVPVIIDANHVFPNDIPVILEGTVPGPLPFERSNAQ